MESVFAQRFKHVITIKGITQKWVAITAHTTEATISRYLNEKHRPPVLETIPKIAQALDVSTDYLLGLSDVYNNKPLLNIDEQTLVSSFRKASDDDVDVIWAILKKYMTVAEREAINAQKAKEKVG